MTETLWNVLLILSCNILQRHEGDLISRASKCLVGGLNALLSSDLLLIFIIASYIIRGFILMECFRKMMI